MPLCRKRSRRNRDAPTLWEARYSGSLLVTVSILRFLIPAGNYAWPGRRLLTQSLCYFWIDEPRVHFGQNYAVGAVVDLLLERHGPPIAVNRFRDDAAKAGTSKGQPR
jgi:hypothetical protein